MPALCAECSLLRMLSLVCTASMGGGTCQTAVTAATLSCVGSIFIYVKPFHGIHVLLGL